MTSQLKTPEVGRDDSTKRRVLTFVKYFLITVFAIPWVVIPLWLVIVNSFKTPGEAGALSLALPDQWAMVENYTAVFVQGNYLTGLRNSLIVAVPTVAATLLLGAMAAWAYARSRKRSFQFFFYLSALSILLPPAIIPTIYVLSALNLDGSLAGYSLMMVGTRMGVIVFLITGFVRTIPEELEEAAAIDGASRLRIFRSIMLPLLSPTLFVGAVLLVIGVWNDFFFALLLLKTSANATLPLTLYSFASASTTSLNWNLVFAHVAMTSIPLVIVYLLAQKRVLAGLTEGGVKG